MKWEENVRKVVPYVPGEQPQEKDIIKLNTNECPYPPSPMVDKAIKEMDYQELRLYPEFPEKTPLAARLAEYHHVKEEQIFIGVGSDDVLSMAFLTFFNSDRPVFFPDITYSFYDVWADIYRIPFEMKPLDAAFHIRKEDYIGKDCGGVIFPNPNAPTGLYENVSEFVGMNVPVIIDEAYIDFSRGQSLATAAANSQNAVVVKTFSKSYALAGMRCGYAVAGAEIIDGLNRVKNAFNSYSVNTVTQAAATAALRDKEYFNGRIADVVRTRDAFCDTLNRLGYACAPSQTNFLLATVPDGNGEKAYRFLKENGVLVRWFNAPRLSDKLRITVGTDEEMDALASLLKQREK